ncbi:hypothetical protein A1Q1_03828 [Trichosporon asahii var. asahii CBS 2479]|uniref:Carbohydrate kinase PfkB domain-containing protein n=1 Tax=Trichosporon asahii var. asahii (strain ATCC 90039 / CBS 2479 / JCM 2466 / KCTC 7840 / NBRC 103889/ NCYC 2677 / UAMH 7654) TaxID=1186058 RepID=J6EX00_TRIAS|nr:hypothetical protein A1Q1_03828 [Trichosporon asahii var. asahii CBS 2479]EJT47357.1 hypothetical protein A1Q1_03828 [Trichosporon asahii var. asahii CBS 2479]
MPYPANAETAASLETIIRGHGVVPATIALMDGKVQVGLSDAQLEELANAPRTESCKVSRRDLGAALCLKRYGGTTVAGTMILANSVGIQHFVTGGIGGVHRGAENSMDVSADLVELGRTPMSVVCAGAKSILDIPRTLEYLETQGVCVAALSEKSGDFPAFYSPSSGEVAPWHFKDIREAAQVVQTNLTLPSPQATLVGVPIPQEYAQRGEEVQRAVEQAVRESVEQGIDKRGKEVTPWLLKRVGELTGGTALELNIALIQNNAHVGAQLVREIWAQREQDFQKAQNASSSAYFPSPGAQPASSSPKRQLESLAQIPDLPDSPDSQQAPVLPDPSVVVFGSAAVDITASTALDHPGSTSPGSVQLTAGGVGRNLARAAQALLPDNAVQLVSPVGTDGLAAVLKSEMADGALRTDGLLPREGRTASCVLFLSAGELSHGVADMSIVETLSASDIAASLPSTAELVVFDLNLSSSSVAALLQTCAERNLRTFCDPTSVAKTPRLLPGLLNGGLTHFAPNLAELDALHSALEPALDDTPAGEAAWEAVNALNLGAEFRAAVESRFRSVDWVGQTGAIRKVVGLTPFMDNVWLKAGAGGVLSLRFQDKRDAKGVSQRIEHGKHKGQWLNIRHYPAPVVEGVLNTTGAGDTLAGSLISSLSTKEEEGMVDRALQRVKATLESHHSVA